MIGRNSKGKNNTKSTKKSSTNSSKNKKGNKKYSSRSQNKNKKYGDSKSNGRKRNQTPRKAVNEEVPDSVVRCYGDLMNDGVVQISFTLPVAAGPEAKVAAQKMCEQMGLKNINVIHMESMATYFTFFVVYAVSEYEVDVSKIEVPKLDHPEYSFDEVNDILRDKVGRTITVLGACIGSDAHTVGIDAIFNMKGYLGDYGLERYPMINAMNLRAQVDINDLVNKIVETQADAVLISRVVTQRDEHITEMKNFLEVLSKADHVPKHLIKICGGPRVDHKLAQEIGYDAGFGPGTLPGQVASYIAEEIASRIGSQSSQKNETIENNKDLDEEDDD